MSATSKLVSIGNYRLLSNNLGKGTFARVELATHVLLQKQVALKVIIKSEIKDPYMRKHLHREAAILGRLDHPNIVKLVEICRSTDVYCLVLEYVPGGTLFDHVHKKGAIPEDQCRFLCKQLISAIAYLHKERILHRDLKLENILLDGSRLVLIDFGLSNNWYPGKVMHTHCGSAEYASPELFRKDIPYSSGVDVWSFGIVLYAMSMGHLPFQIDADDSKGDTLPSLIQKIMKGLGASHYKELNRVSIDCRVLIIRCLDVSPDTRISVKMIVSDSWVRNAPGPPQGSGAAAEAVDEVQVAATIKEKLRIRLSPKEIAQHVALRRYGTTGGCFNLVKLEEHRRLRMEDQLKLDIVVPGPADEAKQQPPAAAAVPKAAEQISKTAEDILNQLKQSASCDVPEKEAAEQEIETGAAEERRSRSQDSRAPLSWRRSFLNMNSSGKISFSRLKRVDKSEERTPSKDTDSGIFRAMGQRALEDISNSVRPLLLRRNSQKEAGPAKQWGGSGGENLAGGQDRGRDTAQDGGAPPHIPTMLLRRDEQGGSKLKLKFANREESKRRLRRPLR